MRDIEWRKESISVKVNRIRNLFKGHYLPKYFSIEPYSQRLSKTIQVKTELEEVFRLPWMDCKLV